jgi:hypothetical protein
MSIQRYNTYSNRSEDGIFVLYDDHVAAVAAVEQRVRDRQHGHSIYRLGNDEGRADGVRAAREAVAASPSCCNCTAPTTTSGEHDGWCMVFKILAAIDGVKP